MKPRYTVQLTYFKESGRYYTEGEYTTDIPELWDIWDDVYVRREQGRLPGLAPGAKEFHVLVNVPDLPHAYPELLPLRKPTP